MTHTVLTGHHPFNNLHTKENTMTRALLISLFLGLFMLPIFSPDRQGHALANSGPKSAVSDDQKRETRKQDAHHARQHDKKHKKEPLAQRIEQKAEETLHQFLKHKNDIGLTEEQVSQLKGMKLDFERSRIRSHADLDVAEVELTALLKDPNTELPTIEAKVRETEQFRGTLIFTAIKTKRAAIDLLSPEQRDRAKDLRKHGAKHAELGSPSAIDDDPTSPIVANHRQGMDMGQ